MTMGFCHSLQMLGIEVSGLTVMLIDNQSVVANVTLPSSCLKKKRNSITYHRVREAAAVKVIVIVHVCGTNNIADIATKALGVAVVWCLLSNLLYGRNTLDFSLKGGCRETC
jgi:hypothetical protein